MRLTIKQRQVMRLVAEFAHDAGRGPVFYVHNFHYKLKDGTDVYLGAGNTHEGFVWTYARRTFDSLVLKGLLQRPTGGNLG